MVEKSESLKGNITIANQAQKDFIYNIKQPKPLGCTERILKEISKNYYEHTKNLLLKVLEDKKIDTSIVGFEFEPAYYEQSFDGSGYVRGPVISIKSNSNGGIFYELYPANNIAVHYNGIVDDGVDNIQYTLEEILESIGYSIIIHDNFNPYENC